MAWKGDEERRSDGDDGDEELDETVRR